MSDTIHARAVAELEQRAEKAEAEVESVRQDARFEVLAAKGKIDQLEAEVERLRTAYLEERT